MKEFIVVAALAALAAYPAVSEAQFPGRGGGVGGTPPSTTGTFPGAANGGIFPGGGPSNSAGGTVTASEPLTLALVGVGLLGASLLRRRRQN